MWESIGEILTSDNAIIVICFLGFMAFMAVLMIKKGIINIHTDAVSIGAADKERKIIRMQMEWVIQHLESLEASIEKSDKYNEWRGRYVVERMYDYYVDRITQNHITNATEYVEVLQANLMDIVDSLTVLPEYKTDEFKEMIKEDTKYVVSKLVQIRKVYK